MCLIAESSDCECERQVLSRYRQQRRAGRSSQAAYVAALEAFRRLHPEVGAFGVMAAVKDALSPELEVGIVDSGGSAVSWASDFTGPAKSRGRRRKLAKALPRVDRSKALHSKEPYVVTFYKTVMTHYGREREISERVIEVLASDAQLALEQAKAEFCRLEGLRDWSLHADRYEVERPARPLR